MSTRQKIFEVLAADVAGKTFNELIHAVRYEGHADDLDALLANLIRHGQIIMLGEYYLLSQSSRERLARDAGPDDLDVINLRISQLRAVIKCLETELAHLINRRAVKARG